jgi:hypothetical protein
MKNILYALSVTACLLITAAFKTTRETVGLSGIWVLNVSKSDFGDSPAFVLQKQLEITDNKTIVKIKYTATTEAGADSIFTLTYTPGKVLDNLTAEKRTQHFQTSWVDNNQAFKIEHSSSFCSKPDTVEYHAVQHFQLSADGKELTLDKQVKVYNGYAYAVKGVYEKQ